MHSLKRAHHLSLAVLLLIGCSEENKSDINEPLCEETAKPADAITCECIDGNWEKCTFNEGKNCDESQKPADAITCECAEGNWENCIYTEENNCDDSQKPAGAITCECLDGNWENCIFTEDSACDESQKPENAITCECIDGNWAHCTYPEGDKCADSNCDPGTTCDPEDGQCKPNPGIPQTCDETQKPADATTCECINGNWENCTFPEDNTCDNNAKPENSINCECIDGKWENCIIDTTEARLLLENIVYNYHLDAKETQPTKHLLLVDFSAKGYESVASKEYTKNGQKIFKWDYSENKLTFPSPRNLSEYDTLTFDVYVPEESVDQTFYMYFQSENTENEGMDYYGKIVKLSKSGWNSFSFKLSDFGTSRTPLGWDQIDKLVLTSTGWDQTNDTSTTIYLGSFQLKATPAKVTNGSKKIVDFSSENYKANASTKYTKTGKVSFEWKYSTSGYTFAVPQNLSAYKAISFWVYVPPESVHQTFYMTFRDSNNSDAYYGYKFELNRIGWIRFALPLNRFQAEHSPKGWKQIGQLNVYSDNWSQTNNKTTTIYLDDIYLYNNIEDALHPSVEIPGAFFSLNGARSIVDDQLINNAFNDDSARVFIKDGEYWLPLTVFGARYDKESTYDFNKNIIEMTLNKKHYRFEAGKNTALIDDKETALEFTPVVVGKALFAPQSYIKSLMGYAKAYVEKSEAPGDGKMEFIYLYNTPFDFSSLNVRLEIMYETLFMRPSAPEAVAKMFNHLGGDVHPRVMMTQERFDELKELLNAGDEKLKWYYEYIKTKYDPNSDNYKTPVEYKVENGRLLDVSREAKRRIIHWALLYKLTDDNKYKDRLWCEINVLVGNETSCDGSDIINVFTDWHPQHYLDTAEILFPMAIAYDWLYNDWSDKERKLMEKKVLEYGLKTGLERYESKEEIWSNNNWTQVCNGGLTAASIAFANAKTTVNAAQEVLNYSIRDFEGYMYTYAPDGGYVESPEYWSFGTDFMHILISSLDSATGSTQGLYFSPGFAKSAYFTTYLENDAGSWGFHDSGSGLTDTNCQPWFARKSNDPLLGYIRYKDLLDNKGKNNKKQPYAYDIMWYTPELIKENENSNLDAHFTQVGITTMRSSWNKNSLLVGLHGGSNSVSHGDLDIGNFILFAAGQRFIIDLGSENYNVPKYFGEDRYKYYKKRAEGQNTLVIGDVSYDTPDQVKNTIGEFIRNEFSKESAVSIVDMKTAYTTVDSGARGVWFKDNRSTVVLQDEIKLKSEQFVRWGVHAQTASWYSDSGDYLNKCVVKETLGEIQIINDGRSAIITRKGADQHLYVEIVSSDKSLKFTKELARSYDTHYPEYTKYPERPSYHVNLPGHETQYEHCRIGIEKLAIITPNKVKSFNVAVVFKMVNNDASDPAIGKTYTWTDMAKWNVE